MTTLLTADIHLTDHPRDEHRWGLLPWIREQVKIHKVRQVAILGDLTDEKDRHRATLVSRLVHQVVELEVPVIIVAGNHDYVDPARPFFGFLSELERVVFVSGAEAHGLGAAQGLFLGSTRKWSEDWKDVIPTFGKYQYIFCHQTFIGAQTENGLVMDQGVPTSVFVGYKGRVFSGDIHVPQKVGPVEYVGAPYRIDFGDRFSPRVVLLKNDGSQVDLRFPCKNKHQYTVTVGGDVSIARQLMTTVAAKGDQVKFKVRIKRADLPELAQVRSQIGEYSEKKGWELYGIEPMLSDAPSDPTRRENSSRRTAKQVLSRFATSNSLDPQLLEVGAEIVESVK